ncbi:MAG: LuxR C-terminal-related transcriptional regulator [Roseiarcus sp.]
MDSCTCEALSWPAEGKTVTDIAVLMKISPEAVKAHLDSARRPTVT